MLTTFFGGLCALVMAIELIPEKVCVSIRLSLYQRTRPIYRHGRGTVCRSTVTR